MNLVNRKNKIDFPIREEGRGKKKYVIPPIGTIHIAIYVPSTTQSDRKVKANVFQKRIRETINFLNRFGGSTRYLGMGSFVNEKNRTIIEEVAIVESYVTEKDYRKSDVEIYNWLKRKCNKENWSQDAIGFVYNGVLFYIS